MDCGLVMLSIVTLTPPDAGSERALAFLLGRGQAINRLALPGLLLELQLQVVDQKSYVHVGDSHGTFLLQAFLHLGQRCPVSDPGSDQFFCSSVRFIKGEASAGPCA